VNYKEQNFSIPSVFIIILNWNGWKDTIECLESIQQLNYSNYRMVLLDNGSTDDSLEKIYQWAEGKIKVDSKHIHYRSDNKNIQIINYDKHIAENGGSNSAESILSKLSSDRGLVIIDNKENLGFAKGCNVGIRYALKAGAEYIWLLNNDTVVNVDTLSKYLTCLETDNQCQGVSGPILYYHNPDLIWNCGGKLKWYGARKYFNENKNVHGIPNEGTLPISFVTGCSVMFRAAVFKKLGLITERFFMGEDDFEFSQRLKKHGYKMACRYDAIIYHKVSVTFQGASLIGSSYIYYLCRFINMRSYWSRITWRIWRILYAPYIFFMLKIRLKLKWIEIWKMLRKLFHDSVIMDGVDRSTHMKALKFRK
jgi:GT2 family glycosyltransferase